LKGSTINYYERHIGDYLKDTAHLSLLEHGVYGRLLDVYYTRENGIDEGMAARLIGARSKDELAALAVILAEFFVLRSGVWTHGRCDREIERYRKRADHNRAVGKLGGRPRKVETRTEPEENPVGFQKEPEPNPQETLASNQKPVTKEKNPPATRVPPCPDGVSGQVWSDWLALRKAKKAPVTETVLRSANAEAVKAGMSLEAFLQVWCARGSQGLSAEWVKPTQSRSDSVMAGNIAAAQRYLERAGT
jgi:uncharacterized protein YdaU (DUF1376 family)